MNFECVFCNLSVCLGQYNLLRTTNNSCIYYINLYINYINVNINCIKLKII